jgi:hypothetical protein
VLGDSVPPAAQQVGEPGESYEVNVRDHPDANESSRTIRLDGDLEAVVVYPDDFDGGLVACDGFATTEGQARIRTASPGGLAVLCLSDLLPAQVVPEHHVQVE